MNSAAEADLSPCPLCGGRAALANYIVEACVSCTQCGVRVVRKHAPHEDTGVAEAIAAWNRRAARAEARPAPEPKRHREIVDAIWQELCEKDDRNSPAEYPDMALVTHDELSGYVAVAMAEAAWQASQARPATQAEGEK